MIRGFVDHRYQAVVRLRVRGPSGIEIDVDAVFDSGFTDSLALPPDTIAVLGLVRQIGGTAVMADGSLHHFDHFPAEVEWDGVWRRVMASALGDEALLGMRLLAGHQLRMDVDPGGIVEISALP